MRVPIGWLREIVDVEVPPEELAARLTAQGVTVDGIEWLGQGIGSVYVARVDQLLRHADADGLWVVGVDVGARGRAQVVTGAQNLRVGDLVPWIEPGATLPGRGRIERKALRGVDSEGMLLSAEELGLGPDAAGIFVLDADATPGDDVARLLALPAPVLVLDLTPNMAVHCQSMVGVAQEVAAAYGLAMRMPSPPPLPQGRLPVEATIESDADCARYSLGMVEWPDGVGAARTPAWMRLRLLASNVRLHGLAVDITNYVMLELGQPLHAFDADTLSGDVISVRRARPGEELTTLDGVDRRLTPEQLVIADGRGPIGLAGVMGGALSEVGDGTRRILLESAVFQGRTVRRSGRPLGLLSEAQGRFEKGVDPTVTPVALARAMELARLGGAPCRVEDGVVDIGPGREASPRTLLLRPARVTSILGLDLSGDEIEGALRRLSFGVSLEADGRLRVTVPVRRGDVEGEIDLVEEVGRVVGYDRLEARLPKGRVTLGSDRSERVWQETLADAMVAQGLTEHSGSTLVASAELDRLGFGQDGRIRLEMPLGPEADTLRPSLLPSLLRALRLNVERGRDGVWLFERGVVMQRAESALGFPTDPALSTEWTTVAGWPFEERESLAAIAFGPRLAADWHDAPAPADVFALKGVLAHLLADAYGREGEAWQTAPLGEGDGWAERLHPGRRAAIVCGGRQVGVLGEIHPAILAALDLPGPVIYWEWWHGTGPAPRQRGHGQPPRVPAVYRDVAVILPDDVPAAAALGAVRTAGGNLVEDVRVFDLYRGQGIPAQARSLALRVRYRATDHTLREDEVEPVHEAVREALRTLGGTLRS